MVETLKNLPCEGWKTARQQCIKINTIHHAITSIMDLWDPV